MNRHVLVVLASLFIVAGARAQSVGFAGNIPFDFVVGNTTLRAGQYTITPITMNGSTLLLRGSDSTQAIFITPCLCASGNDSHETKLVFHVYGNHYFLWQIWRQGYDVGSQLSAPVKNGAIMAGSGRSQWSTRESPRSTETQ